MAQITRQLTDCEDGFLNGKTHLTTTEIRDLQDVVNAAEDRTSESGDRQRKYGKCSWTQEESRCDFHRAAPT